MSSADITRASVCDLLSALETGDLDTIRRILAAHTLPALREVVPLPPLLHVLFSSAPPNSDENAAANLISDPSSMEMRRRIAIARVLIHEFGVDPKEKIVVALSGKVIGQGNTDAPTVQGVGKQRLLLFSLLHISCMGRGRDSKLDIKGYGCPLELIPFLVGECVLDVEEGIVEIIVEAEAGGDEGENQPLFRMLPAINHRGESIKSSNNAPFLPYIERTPLELLVSDNFRHQSAASSRDRRRAAVMLLRDYGANAHRHNDHLPDALRLGYRRVIWDTTVSAISHWNLARRFVDDKSPNADDRELNATSSSGNNKSNESGAIQHLHLAEEDAAEGCANKQDDKVEEGLELLDLLMTNKGHVGRMTMSLLIVEAFPLPEPQASPSRYFETVLSEFNSARDMDGASFIHLVIRDGRLEVAKILIARYGLDPTVRHRFGESILHWLPKINYFDPVRYQIGARGSGAPRRAAHRRVLTSTAAEEEEEGEKDPDEWEDFAAFVLERVDDVNAFACDSQIPPYCPLNSYYAPSYCVCKTCDPSAIRCQCLPLIHAAVDFVSQLVLTRLLLEKYRVNTAITARCHTRPMQTPLHVFCVAAARRCRIYASPARWAEETARTIRLLVANYCPTEDEPTLVADGGIDAQDVEGNTALHLVVACRNSPVAGKAFLVGLLIREFGANTNLRNHAGETALEKLFAFALPLTSPTLEVMSNTFIHMGGAAIGPSPEEGGDVDDEHCGGDDDGGADTNVDGGSGRRIVSAFNRVKARRREFASDDDERRRRFVVCVECPKGMVRVLEQNRQ